MVSLSNLFWMYCASAMYKYARIYPSTKQLCIVADCWSVLLLVLCGDVETNPGPQTRSSDDLNEHKDVLSAILEELKEIKTAANKRDETLTRISSNLDEVLKLSKANKEKIQTLQHTVEHLKKTVAIQGKRLNDYEDRSRRNNLVVFGIPEGPEETREVLEDLVVRRVCNDELEVTVTSLERIHRIGKPRNDKPRPIILRLYNYNEKIAILNNCFKLKDSEVSVSHDFSQAKQHIRKKLWQSKLCKQGRQ